MQIKPPGLFSRGKIAIGFPAHHITPDSLVDELGRAWAPQGFTVYKSALIGLDVVLKKSGWTGVGLKIKQNNGMTELAYNAFAPSAMVRVMAMGLIPILIVNSTSWKPLLRSFAACSAGGYALPLVRMTKGVARSFNFVNTSTAPGSTSYPPNERSLSNSVPSRSNMKPLMGGSASASDSCATTALILLLPLLPWHGACYAAIRV